LTATTSLANNLSVHARKHLYSPDDPDDWIRKAARARKVLGDPGATQGHVELRPKDALRTVVTVGLHLIDAGVSVPERADVIRAAKELQPIENEGQPATEAEMMREIKAFTLAVKRHVPEDMWEQLYTDYEIILGAAGAPSSLSSVPARGVRAG
jgi:hypothetical protein